MDQVSSVNLSRFGQRHLCDVEALKPAELERWLKFINVQVADSEEPDRRRGRALRGLHSSGLWMRVQVDFDVGMLARRLLRIYPAIVKPQDGIHLQQFINNVDELHTYDRENLIDHG